MPMSQCFLEVCKNCEAYCCGIVRPPVTEKEREEVLGAGYQDYFIEVKNGIYEIKPTRKRLCPYLTEGYSCEIHVVKPQLCRVWPVVPRLRNEKLSFLVIKCPLYQYLSAGEVEQAKREAGCIPRSIITQLWIVSSELKNKFKVFEYEEI